MTTMALARAALVRNPRRKVILRLDQCENEYGQAPCTASGGHCHFTWPTCKDPDNYAQGSYDWVFVDRSAPASLGYRPYIMGKIDAEPTKIQEDQVITERGKVTVHLQDDNAEPLACPNKSTSPAGAITTGARFWPAWLNWNSRYAGRLVEVYEGFDSVADTSWELVFRGRIKTIEIEKAGVVIEANDLLYKTNEVKAPLSITDDNVIEDNPLSSGATAITVTTPEQFPYATAKEPQCAKIRDEYIIYTGKNATQLTGCTRGCFGTTAAQHVYGTAIQAILMYCENNTDWDGIAPDSIWLDLVLNRTRNLLAEPPVQGISIDHVAVEDVGMTIAEDLDDSETAVDVNDSSLVPDTGWIIVGSELIQYTGKSGDTLTPCLRGMCGTTAAAHSNGVAACPPTITYEIGRWIPGRTRFGWFENSNNVGDLLNSLSQSLMGNTWCNDEGKIEFRMQMPPRGTDYTVYTEADIIPDTRKIAFKDDKRKTRLFVAYWPSVPDAPAGLDLDEDSSSDYAESYNGLAGDGDLEAEAAESYGEIRSGVMKCPWIKDTDQALWLAMHLRMKYGVVAPEMNMTMDQRNDAFRTGHLRKFAVPELVDEDGAPITKWYRLISKKREDDGKISFEAVDSGYGTERYGRIGPKNGILDANITDVATTFDLDVSGTTLTISNFRDDGGIMMIDEEDIGYATVADLGGSVLRFSGCTRGVGATSPAAHTAGAEVIRTYSAAPDNDREESCWIGDTADNYVDDDGDGTTETAGYLIG